MLDTLLREGLGVACSHIGLPANVLEVTPSLTLTAAEALAVIAQALRDVTEGRLSNTRAPCRMW